MKKPSEKEINRRHRRLSTNREIRRAYLTPKIEIHSDLASPSFTKVVESIITGIDFDQPPFKYPEIGRFFQNISRSGLERSHKELGDSLRNRLNNLQLNGPPRRVQLDPLQIAINAMGEFIVDSICRLDESLLPMNDVEVLVQQEVIRVGLSSMLHRSIGNRDFYFSRKRLQLAVEGHSYTLAFSKHSIDQICSRFRPDFLNYGGLGEAHALFSYLNFVEPIVLPAGNLAVALFDFCNGPGSWQYDNYVGRCMPDAPVRGHEQWISTGKPYGYRLGYCPIDLVDQYAIVRTFLPPGFAKTPERRLLRQKCHDAKQKFVLSRAAQEMGCNTLRFGKGFDAIELFHRNVIPQVIDPPIPLFDYEYRAKKFGDSL